MPEPLGIKEKKWELLPTPDPILVQTIARDLGISPVIAQVLINRDLRTLQACQAFLDISLDNLEDPFKMQDMAAGVTRVLAAIEKHEKIMIYGDYDVDGITSIALMYRGLGALGADVSYYVPNRLEEGYGMSCQGVYHAQEHGVTLIISVDCGITAAEEVIFATERDIDVIVTDHHEPGVVMPRAVAVIDPKRADCTYPFKELAGVGIAFKFLEGIYRKKGIARTELVKFLDLVALGTAADIVPLVGENRILVKYGINQMEQTENTGIRSLLKMVRLERKNAIDTGRIVFMLAPRLNASGRLGDAEKGIRLLITSDPVEADRIADQLEGENRKRKDIDALTFQAADQMYAGTPALRDKRSIVLFAEGWHVGVIGIVASRLVEKYYLPTVLISFEDGIGRGSARSISNFDIYHAFHECSDLLESFGGHKYAAGLSVRRERVDEFREKFNQVAVRMIKPEDLLPKLTIDADLDLDEIDSQFLSCVQRFAPFGPRNMQPVFVSYGTQLVGEPQLVGNGNHIKFKVRHKSRVFDCIGFNLADQYAKLNTTRSNLGIAYHIEENVWNDRVTIQLRIKGIK